MTRLDEVLICIKYIKNEMKSVLQDVTETMDLDVTSCNGTQLVVLSQEMVIYLAEYKELAQGS